MSAQTGALADALDALKQIEKALHSATEGLSKDEATSLVSRVHQGLLASPLMALKGQHPQHDM